MSDQADKCEKMEDCLYWLKNRREATEREVRAIDDFMASVSPSALAALYDRVRRDA